MTSYLPKVDPLIPWTEAKIESYGLYGKRILFSVANKQRALDRGVKSTRVGTSSKSCIKLRPGGRTVCHESLSICMNYTTWIRPHKRREILQELGWMSNAPIMPVDGTLHLAEIEGSPRGPRSRSHRISTIHVHRSYRLNPLSVTFVVIT